MKPLGDANTHYWLLQGMLRRTGADAVTAFARGDLGPEDWAALVGRCRSCAAPQACRAFLDDPEAGRKSTPVFCRNAKALSMLPICEEDKETV